MASAAVQGRSSTTAAASMLTGGQRHGLAVAEAADQLVAGAKGNARKDAQQGHRQQQYARFLGVERERGTHQRRSSQAWQQQAHTPLQQAHTP